MSWNQPSMIGAYGAWAAAITGEKAGSRSLRAAPDLDLDRWRDETRRHVLERMAPPDLGPCPAVEVLAHTAQDGLEIQQVAWQLPAGPPTSALVVKPAGATGPLPGILAFHDHGGLKTFGWERIARGAQAPHPLAAAYVERAYGGRYWVNELARRGYVVMAHDAFAFGSRRVRAADVPTAIRMDPADAAQELNDDISTVESAARYNRWAREHESIMAKSLFSAGTTWPGVTFSEDQIALEILAARPDVDASRLGCGGLSGGGLRTVHLGGLDPRIRCAVCAGMMTTWRDFLLHKSVTHTWMIYIPHLPRELDYPEILGLRAPLPTLVLNNADDPLFTPDEMHRADAMLRQVFDIAGGGDAYACQTYPGPHKFDQPMQEDAFDWFDRWLQPNR